MRDTLLSCRFAAVILALTVPVLVLAQDAEEDADEAEAIVEEPIELTAQTVTGSRLIGGDPSAKLVVFSAEDIARRGVSSLEDLFRTLPWAFSSMTTQTNTTFGGGAADTDFNPSALGLGTSTVNLRALGSANTLVLVDGRRVAGKAGNEDNPANLLNVPMSAVERVEIQLDGASAIYGADAIGGVVNFIMKKDYRGLSVTARNEWSGTDADRSKINVTGGFSWDTGNLTATVSQTKSKPINNYKIWTSNDYRSQYGPEFDKRSTFHGQPGKVCDHNGSYTYIGCSYPYSYLQLTSGSGIGATPGDFTSSIEPVDFVLPQNGEDSTTNELTVSIEQYLTDSFRIYASAQGSDHEAYQQFQSGMYNYLIPASNAYNPFGKPVVVSYYPLRELQEGRIPYSYTESEDKQRNYAVGFYWEVADKHQLHVDVSWSESNNFVWQVRTDYGPVGRSRYNPSSEAFYRALESSDPNVALNLFGDGTAQGSAFAELFTNGLGPSRGVTETTIIKSLMRGEAFRIWGGAVRYVAGLETEERKTYESSERWGPGGLAPGFGTVNTVGIAQPKVKDTAFFTELTFPLFGPENARPGLRGLDLSVQLRKDNYTHEGASGGVGSDRVPGTRAVWIPNQGWTEIPSGRWIDVGEPNLVTAKQAATTYRLGMRYQPVESFQARLNWSTTFKPANPGDLFTTDDVREYDFFCYVDPYHPDGLTDEICPLYRIAYGNPDLKPETSDTYRVVLDWNPESIPGLALSLDWSHTDFADKIEYGSIAINDYPEIGFANPLLVERDADGYVTQINDAQINLAEKVSEILTVRAQYTFQTAIGSLTPRLSYSPVLDEYFTIVSGSPRVERVGTAKGSDEYKLEGSVTWVADKLSADLFAYYTPSYKNDRAGGCRKVVGRCGAPYWLYDLPTLTVGALTTVDLTVTYQFDNGLRLRGGGRNIFDADSPTVWNQLPYDPTRWDARGRVLFLELNYEM